MSKQSAGILVFRRRRAGIEVFLVHPGGPFWAKKDHGAWSIPKGEFAGADDPLTAARREFEEEVGQPIDGAFIALTPCRQPSGKMIHAFAVEGDVDADTVTSNTFEIEWPPRSGRRQMIPEVDRAAWFDREEARKRILPGQVPILDELAAKLGG